MMRVRLIACGVDRGEREIGDNCIAALLLRGDFGGAVEQTAKMQAEIDELAASPVSQESEAVAKVKGG